jgi:hypothetical protein
LSWFEYIYFFKNIFTIIWVGFYFLFLWGCGFNTI